MRGTQDGMGPGSGIETCGEFGVPHPRLLRRQTPSFEPLGGAGGRIFSRKRVYEQAYLRYRMARVRGVESKPVASLVYRTHDHSGDRALLLSLPAAHPPAVDFSRKRVYSRGRLRVCLQ